MFLDNFEKLCKEKGISPTGAVVEIGFSNATYSNWKKRGSTPQGKNLQKIADYFGVTVNDLLADNIEPTSSVSQSQLLSNTDCPSLTDTPAILVRLYEKLNVLYNTPGGKERLQELEETADTWIAKWQTTQQKMEELELLKAKVQQMELELAEEQKLQ